MGCGMAETLQSLAFLSIASRLLLSVQRVLVVVTVVQEGLYQCLFQAALDQSLPVLRPLNRRLGGIARVSGKNSHTPLHSTAGQVGIVPELSASPLCTLLLTHSLDELYIG